MEMVLPLLFTRSAVLDGPIYEVNYHMVFSWSMGNLESVSIESNIVRISYNVRACTVDTTIVFVFTFNNGAIFDGISPESKFTACIAAVLELYGSYIYDDRISELF